MIVYLGRRPFQQEDLDIVRKLVNLLGLKLRRHQVGMDRWTATLQAKLEVLLDPSTPPQVRQPAVDLLRQEIKGEYGIMVTTIGARASQRAFADYAVSQIQQRFRNVVVLVYDEAIVTLFGEVKRNAVDSQLRPENNELVKWLFRYFEQYDLVSGLSDQFADLDSIYLRYRRALLTARMVERVKGSITGSSGILCLCPCLRRYWPRRRRRRSSTRCSMRSKTMMKKVRPSIFRRFSAMPWSSTIRTRQRRRCPFTKTRCLIGSTALQSSSMWTFPIGVPGSIWS